jgi:hypothetical protein
MCIGFFGLYEFHFGCPLQKKKSLMKVPHCEIFFSISRSPFISIGVQALDIISLENSNPKKQGGKTKHIKLLLLLLDPKKQ